MKYSKDVNTIKSFIITYLSLKILNNEFKTNQHVPSENVLASKFNCSRLTARSAIIVLVHLGILYAVKGSGHYVSENAIKILLPTLFISNHSNKIENNELEHSDNRVLQKSVYYDNENVVGEVYWSFDKKIFDNSLSQYENINDFSKQLINAGIIGIKVIESLKVIDNKIYIHHEHYDEKAQFLFEFSLWYENMETISERIYLKM